MTVLNAPFWGIRERLHAEHPILASAARQTNTVGDRRASSVGGCSLPGRTSRDPDSYLRVLTASRLGLCVSVRKDNFEHAEAGDEQSEDHDTDDSDASLACGGDRYCSENECCDAGHVRGEKGDSEPEIVEELLATSLTGGDQENERRKEADEGRHRK